MNRIWTLVTILVFIIVLSAFFPSNRWRNEHFAAKDACSSTVGTFTKLGGDFADKKCAACTFKEEMGKDSSGNSAPTGNIQMSCACKDAKGTCVPNVSGVVSINPTGMFVDTTKPSGQQFVTAKPSS